MSEHAGPGLSKEQPFAGLRPFDFADRHFFFGRQSQIYALYRLLDRSHFIAVVGNSGSGKSSLVRAGLLPMLDDWWARITVQPGSAPLSSLVTALVDLAARAAGSGADLDVLQQLIEHAVRQSSFGLANALAHIPAMANKKLLVVVDQFEEIFRYADSGSRDEATHFVQILLEASRSKSYDIRVMITMRSDFIGECARFQNLPEAVSASQFLVPSLSRDQREEVIRRPIDRAGGTIEPDLVERLLNDAGYELDQLPVLQHCLSRMWGLARLRAPDSPAITELDYRLVGQMSGAISQHADQIMLDLGGLTPVVEQVFRALSERDKDGRAIRRAIPFRQLVEEAGMDPSDVRAVVDRFRQADCSFLLPSLVAVRELRDDTRIDVVHEALLRRWKRITGDDPEDGWLDDEDEDGRYYRSLLARIDGGETTLPIDRVKERYAWWTSRPRTEAWAARYGGQRDRVQQFFDDSLAAFEADAAEKVEQRRQREEALRKIAVRTGIAAAVTAIAIIVGIAGAAYAYSRLSAQERQIQLERSQLERAALLEKTKDRQLLEGQAQLQRDAAVAHVKDAQLTKEGTNLQILTAHLKQGAVALEREQGEANTQRGLATDALANADVVQSRFLSREAINDVNSGDAVTGALLALEALPLQIAHPDRPFVNEAESALEMAVAHVDELRDFRGHEGLATSAAFSYDGTKIVSGSIDKTARVWDARTANTIAVLPHSALVKSVAFSPNDARILTVSGNAAYLWDAVTYKRLAVLQHRGAVATAVFSPDGERVLTGSADKTVQLWSTQTGAAVGPPLSMQYAVHSAEFSPDGRRAVVAESANTVSLVNLADGRVESDFSVPAVGYAAFSHDGMRVVTYSGDWIFRVWDAAKGTLIAATAKDIGGPYWAEFSPDDTQIVTASSSDARVWDASNGALVKELQRSGAVFSATYSRDGSYIVTASTDGRARVFNAKNGALLAVLAVPEGWVRSASFSPGAKEVVTASDDATVRLWDPGTPIATLQHEGEVTFTAFSPDGTRGVSASDDGTAQLWDGRTGKFIAPLPSTQGVKSAAFSPDSRRVVTGSLDGTARLWYASTGAPIATLKHADQVRSVAFSPDGTTVLTASNDKTAQLWSARDGSKIWGHYADHDTV